MNIIKEAREKEGLSQKQLAEHAGVTPQAVLRYEQGLYQNLSAKIATALNELTDLPLDTIYDKYHLYRMTTQRDAYRFIWHQPIRLNGDEHPFLTWRKAVSNTAVGEESRMAFCILLAVHPAVVAEYDSGRCRDMPALIKHAILNTGMNEDYVERLATFGRLWYESRRNS